VYVSAPCRANHQRDSSPPSAGRIGSTVLASTLPNLEQPRGAGSAFENVVGKRTTGDHCAGARSTLGPAGAASGGPALMERAIESASSASNPLICVTSCAVLTPRAGLLSA